MARSFVTTNIVDPVKAPISKRSLTHINTAWDELGEDILRSLLSGYTTNDVVVLYGCEVTANIPGTSSVTAGAIYYNGRIYKVDANASISTPANTLVWSIATTYISGDPATFSDSSSNNFHKIEKFQLTNATSGSGIANYNGATVKPLTGQFRNDFYSITESGVYTLQSGDVRIANVSGGTFVLDTINTGNVFYYRIGNILNLSYALDITFDGTGAAAETADIYFTLPTLDMGTPTRIVEDLYGYASWDDPYSTGAITIADNTIDTRAASGTASDEVHIKAAYTSVANQRLILNSQFWVRLDV